MKAIFFVCFVFFLLSCNSSSSKKQTTNQAMDDTARMKDPNYVVIISPVKLPVTDIPASISIKGKVQEAWKWTDSLGENILITSYVAPYGDKDGEDGQTAELYAFHYAKKTTEYTQVWMMKEEEKACPFDITCGFIPGSATVTDLDKDGIAETKLQYSVACRSDVSPATMKLIMYENGVKYLLQGNMWLPYSPEFKFEVTDTNVNLEKLPKGKDETEEMIRTFGRYENEKQFAAAPPEFLTYARSEWLKYVKEKMGE